MKSKCLELILALMLFVVVVSGFATTWHQTSEIGNSIGMSADGRILLAVYSGGTAPVISTNWGQTWVNLTNGPRFGSYRPDGVAMSADGTTIIFAPASTPGGVFITTNYGSTWTQTDVVNSNSLLAVACSGDATKLIAAGEYNSPIYFSTNAGVNWYTSSVPNTNWASVASSANGQLMAGIVYGGELYFSTDFGATWAPTNLPVQGWNCVCLSSDGKWVGATGTNTYISSSAGASWITNNMNGNVIACSANGSNWIIGGTQVYTSIDGGVTWTTNLSAAGWNDAAVSADGCEFLVAGEFDWIGHTTPSPQLNIQSTNGNVAFSWLVPSTNFVLQENSDLGTANWVTVSNSPVLNFTNLQDEVSLPPPGSNAFFRLIAQ